MTNLNHHLAMNSVKTVLPAEHPYTYSIMSVITQNHNIAISSCQSGHGEEKIYQNHMYRYLKREQ